MRALFLFIFAAPLAFGQPLSWSLLDGLGPNVANQTAVGEDGSLFVASFAEVFRYNPEAERWDTVVGTFTGSFFDVATGPGGRVWAGTGGAWRSGDGGQTWEWFSVRTAQHSGTPATIFRVAVGPNATVYAGGFRSTNEGATWPAMSIAPLAMAFVGSTAYAGTADGLHQSTSSGASWTPVGLAGQEVGALAASGGTLVAATADGVWRSVDGTAWASVAALDAVITLAATSDGAFWAATPAGLYRSSDGSTWPDEPTAFAGEGIRDVAANGSVLLASVDGVPHHSTDAGATWTALPDGFPFRNATDAFATDDLLAVTGQSDGPFASTDGGATWVPWKDGLPRSAESLCADPSSGWALAHMEFQVPHRAPLTLDAWEPADLPTFDSSEGGYADIACDAEGRLFAASIIFDNEGTPTSDLYRSADGGAAWEIVRSLSGETMLNIAAGGGTLMVTRALLFGQTTGLDVSTDGGATWTARPYPTDALGPFLADEAGRLYIGSVGRFLRSDDAGETWTPLGLMGTEANRMLDLTTLPDGLLCAGTENDGVYCSDDDGATFLPYNEGLPVFMFNDGLPPGPGPVVSVVYHADRFVAVTRNNGVFASGTTVAVEEEAGPADFAVSALYPNPLRSTTRLTLDVAEAQRVEIAVYDLLGRRVALVHDGWLGAETEHAFTLDATALASGVYLLRVSGSAVAVTRRLTVLN